MKKFYEKKEKERETEAREASKEDQLGIFFSFVVFTEVVININAQIVPS